MNTSSTVATAAPSNRITAIIARQRSSRLRDLLFAGALAIGVAFSLGALHDAAAHAAAAAPVAATAHVVTAG